MLFVLFISLSPTILNFRSFYCQEQTYKTNLSILDVQATIREKENDEFIMTDSLELGPDTWG